MMRGPFVGVACAHGEWLVTWADGTEVASGVVDGSFGLDDALSKARAAASRAIEGATEARRP